MREPPSTPCRVLLVDEALRLTARSRLMFASGGLLRLGEGTTPARILDAVLALKPDVIVLELGQGEEALWAVEAVMARKPTPILVLQKGAGGNAFRALSLGALDMATLPAPPSDAALEEAFWRGLEPRLLLLAQVRVVQHVRGMRRDRKNAPRAAAIEEAPFPLVAIAASLGGPKALAQLLGALPRTLVAPVCLCQHISDGFTSALANWLAQESGQRVEEAREDVTLEPGHVYVAPSGRHFRVAAGGRIRLDDGAPMHGFRPSCDALLGSVARSFGRRAIGVVLTGMGRDGADGLKAIRDRGGRTIAQDEPSSAVWGMPREAVRLGAAERVLPLDEIPQAIARLVDEC